MKSAAESTAVLGLGTALPPFRIEQTETAQRLAEALKDHSDAMRWAKRIFKQCGVENRHTVLPELLQPADQCRYTPCTPAEDVPSTAERMAVFKREAVPLGLSAACEALQDSGVEPSAITHLITVSCTGQFLPGMDAVLAVELGLSREVTRIPLNFLGCAAGLKAIALASRFVKAEHSAKVLIVCVELCTLHLQASVEREQLYAASFFGDGASACVVGRAQLRDKGMFQLGEERSVLLPDYAEEMVWEVGDHGFDLYLSPNIPKRIGEGVPPLLKDWLDHAAPPGLWAIHPGGKGIVDALQDRLGLSEEQVAFSRGVLRQYGNMSSVTILFVLKEMRRKLDERKACEEEGIALAFGPGLTAELVRFRYLPSAGVTASVPLEDAYA